MQPWLFFNCNNENVSSNFDKKLKVYTSERNSHSLKFRLIAWCQNCAEMCKFYRVIGYPQKTLQKLSISAKFPHQEIWLFFVLLLLFLCSE